MLRPSDLKDYRLMRGLSQRDVAELNGNPMLELEGKMAFSFIIGFMDGAIPTMYLKQIES